MRLISLDNFFHIVSCLVAAAGHEYEEVLFGLGAVGEVDDEAAREARAHRRRRDHLDLARVLRVELKHRAPAATLQRESGEWSGNFDKYVV